MTQRKIEGIVNICEVNFFIFLFKIVSARVHTYFRSKSFATVRKLTVRVVVKKKILPSLSDKAKELVRKIILS